MSAFRQISCFHPNAFYLIAGCLLFSLNSCIIFQKYPPNKPFSYKTSISLYGEMPKADKREMIAKLEAQLDDSLQSRMVSYAGLWRVVRKPPQFDTSNITRSRTFMSGLLHSMGYFQPEIKDNFSIDTAGDKLKVSVRFQVTPGKQTRIDSIGYQLISPEMQALVYQTLDKRLLNNRSPYSIAQISSEIDRIVQVLHNNGYYKINRDDLYAEVDTVESLLIDPTLDPFEQILLLDSLKKRVADPTLTIVFKQRMLTDSNVLKQYQVGNITVYPDQSLLQDSLAQAKDTLWKGFRFVTYSDRFKIPFLARNVFLSPGARYDERKYYKTLNRFNRLGAWQNVDIGILERFDTVPKLDFNLLLFPALKHNLKIDLEASRNIADYLTTSQFFGLGLNVSFANRNAYRESIQTNTNARFGVEFGSEFIQTLQTNLSHTVYFPRLIVPFGLNPLKAASISNERTILNINGAYTIRREIFDVLSINTSWGYEWSAQKFNFQVIPLNIEYTKLNGKDSLGRLIEKIPSLRFAFNDGFVIGMIGAMNRSWSRRKNVSSFNIRIEESGALFGLIKNLERNNLFRFIKADIEYKHLINYKRSAIALRAFAGYGFVYGYKGDQQERILPFFKAYFAGGPYSMRGWQVRRLGPGSSLLYDTSNLGANDRFGNMKLEFNAEYRFDVTTIAGVKVKSALFTDIGNIWGVEFRDQAATQKIPEASFRLSRLYRDLAVAGGTSLRFDFDFFLIRLDWAYKLKNPSYADINGGWFHKISLNNGQFQLGINYPF